MCPPYTYLGRTAVYQLIPLIQGCQGHLPKILNSKSKQMIQAYSRWTYCLFHLVISCGWWLFSPAHSAFQMLCILLWEKVPFCFCISRTQSQCGEKRGDRSDAGRVSSDSLALGGNLCFHFQPCRRWAQRAERRSS